MREILDNWGQHNLLTALSSRKNPTLSTAPPNNKTKNQKQPRKTEATKKKKIIAKVLADTDGERV